MWSASLAGPMICGGAMRIRQLGRAAAAGLSIVFLLGLMSPASAWEKDGMSLKAWNAMTARAHVIRAKEILDKDVALAIAHLEAISLSAPEYRDAQRLLSTARIKRRQKVADAFEMSFLQAGRDANVTAKGRDKTILTITYALMSRPFVFQFVEKMIREAVFDDLKVAGFTRLVFTDGQSFTVSFPVDEYTVKKTSGP